MQELYEAVLAATKTAVNKEKDSGFSNTTFRMINQAAKLHSVITACQPAPSSQLFSPDDKETEQ